MSSQSITVLIAEDDRDQLDIRSLLVRHEGFTVITGDSAASALQAASRAAPDLGVIDINLPLPSDGLGLIRDLKARHPRVRILALTGASGDALQRLPEAQLVDEILCKGSPVKVLIETLKRLAAGAPLKAAARAPHS